jgi:hypothetical protein
MKLSYRPAEGESDFRFVVETWLDTYRDAHAAGLIQWDDWFTVMRPQLIKVLSRPGVETFVAAWVGEEPGLADLAGWISVERGYSIPLTRSSGSRHRREMVECPEPLVHFVYVKAGYRRGGVARGLFRAAGVDPLGPFRYTCKTGLVTELASRIPYSKWCPLIARHPR